MTHPLTPREKVLLKPCPFCGGEAVAGSNFDNDHYVMCGADCDKCGGMVGYMKTEMAAIENWNRRTALASGSGDHSGGVTDMISFGDHAELAALREHRITADLLVSTLKADKAEAERKMAEAVAILREWMGTWFVDADSRGESAIADDTRKFLNKEVERG